MKSEHWFALGIGALALMAGGSAVAAEQSPDYSAGGYTPPSRDPQESSPDPQISPHFNSSEFDSHDGVPYPVDWIDSRLRPLVAVLEWLRARLGDRPIYVVSGYRSPAHNVAVGGARQSQHMEGRAADIQMSGYQPSEVHATLLDGFQRGEIEIGGLGLYPSWVHVDIRSRPSDGHLAQWSGSGTGDEQT